MKSHFGHFVKVVPCLAYDISQLKYQLLLGVGASDGVVLVEDWVSINVTLSVGSRLLSVDS